MADELKNALLYPVRKLGLPAILLLMFSGLVYWWLGFGLKEDGWFAWDLTIMLELHSFSQPWLDQLFLAITHTVQVFMVVPLLAMLVYLWRQSERITAALLVASAAIFPLVSLVVKQEFGRPRQHVFPPVDVEHTFSFPSGHTLTAIGVYGFIAILLWQRGHRLMAIISGLWVFIIGISRVYLGAHYPSDVLASLAVGTFMLVIVQFVDQQLNAYYARKKVVSENEA